MSSLVEKANEERLTYIMQHPYYGLRDQGGWLTRYPMDQCVWSRSEVKSYLSGGASFDSCEVWGCDPTRPIPAGWENKLNILSRLIKSYGRFDFLPIYPGTFSINESIDLTSYFRLCRGQVVKEYLESWGVEVTNSLFTLAKANDAWLARKIQKHCTREGVIKHLDGSIHYYNFIGFEGVNRLTNSEDDNVNFAYGRTCLYKHKCRLHLRPENRRRYNYISVKSERLAMINIKYGNRFSKSHYNDGLKTEYHTPHKYYNTSVSEGIYVNKDEIIVGGNKLVIAKKVSGLYIARVENTLFVWNPEKGFEDHVECGALAGIRPAIKRYQTIRKATVRKEEILRTGVLTLREFRILTGSCFAGTMSFLYANMPHIARLLEDFYGWHDALASEVADVEWHLSEEAMNSIRHRF